MIDGSGYIRLSREAGDTNTSKAGMEHALRAKAQQEGVNLIAIHVDDGLTGAIRNRPEFLAWLEDARSGRAQVLLTPHADRLTREGVNAAALVLDVVEGKDSETGKVVRPTVRLLDCYGTDSEGDPTAFRFKFVIAAEVARAERDAIVRRNNTAKQNLRRERRFGGGFVPYGYQSIPHPSGKGRALAVEPAEKRHLRTAVDHLLSGGSLYGAVQLLNTAGSKPHRADGWSVTALRACLTGDAILGRMSHKGVPLRDDDGLPVTPWEPIITIEESNRLRALLPGDGSGTYATRRSSARPLSGRIVCGTCGGRLRISGRAERRRYICPGRAGGRDCDGPVQLTAHRIEDHIKQQILDAVGSRHFLDQVISTPDATGLADIDAALKGLSAAMIEPGADVAKIAAQVTELHARRTALAAQRVEPTTRWVDTGLTVAEAWEDERQQQAILDRFLAGPITVRRMGQRARPKRTDMSRVDIPWSDEFKKALPTAAGRDSSAGPAPQ